jgi:adenylate cyclase
MKCSACGHENPLGAIFCNECAVKIELACPQCNKVNPPESRSCMESGARPISPGQITAPYSIAVWRRGMRFCQYP